MQQKMYKRRIEWRIIKQRDNDENSFNKRNASPPPSPDGWMDGVARCDQVLPGVTRCCHLNLLRGCGRTAFPP